MTSPLHRPIAEALRALSPCALAPAWNARSLELAPFGHEIRFLDALRSPDWVDLYRLSNAHSFPGSLRLPGWVLADVFLLPGAIGLLAGKGKDVRDDARLALGLDDDDDAIVAACCAIPSASAGTVVGISLFSLARERGAGRAIKALTLGMLRARRQRGLAQWSNASLRVHTRMGPLRVLGPAPAVHEESGDSFVYEVDLDDHRRWAGYFTGTAPEGPFVLIPVDDRRRLSSLASRAYDGHRIEIVPPGLSPDGSHVYVNTGSEQE